MSGILRSIFGSNEQEEKLDRIARVIDAAIADTEAAVVQEGLKLLIHNDVKQGKTRYDNYVTRRQTR